MGHSLSGWPMQAELEWGKITAGNLFAFQPHKYFKVRNDVEILFNTYFNTLKVPEKRGMLLGEFKTKIHFDLKKKKITWGDLQNCVHK